MNDPCHEKGISDGNKPRIGYILKKSLQNQVTPEKLCGNPCNADIDISIAAHEVIEGPGEAVNNNWQAYQDNKPFKYPVFCFKNKL